MKIHNCEQGSKEWFALRDMRFTASNANAIASNGAGLKTLVRGMFVDHYSTSEEERYTNSDMERGHELEPIARTMYELEKGKKVEEVGFVEVDKHIGFSPDGLVGKDGGFETKALNDANHMKVILFGLKAIDNKFIDQCQFSMLYGKRKWWDLVIFNPNFEKSLLVFRIKPDLERHQKIIVGVNEGVKLLVDYQKLYEKCGSKSCI